MWLLLLLLVAVAAANREADRAFFGTMNHTYQSFIPAMPLDGEEVFFDRVFSAENATQFRFSFNPAGCEDPEKHEVVIALLDDYYPGTGMSVNWTRNRMTFKGKQLRKDQLSIPVWEKQFDYEALRFLDNRAHPSSKSSLSVALTMNDAHFYVHIEGASMYLYVFEENSRDVKFYQVLKNDQPPRFFALWANQHNSCPTFISKVDENFPFWVPGMPLNWTVRGTTAGKVLYDKTQSQPVFKILFIATLIVIALCAVVNTLLLPSILNGMYTRVVVDEEGKLRIRKFDLLDGEDDTKTIETPSSKDGKIRKMRSNEAVKGRSTALSKATSKVASKATSRATSRAVSSKQSVKSKRNLAEANQKKSAIWTKTVSKKKKTGTKEALRTQESKTLVHKDGLDDTQKEVKSSRNKKSDQ